MTISNRKLKKVMRWSGRRKKKENARLFTNDKCFTEKAIAIANSLAEILTKESK